MDKKFYGTLARIAIPIVAQEFINSLVHILDTFMIGSLGVHEITAVGLANQVFFLFILLTFGVNSGAAILMGQFWGAGDVKSIKKTIGLCLCGGLISAALFSCMALFAPKQVMGIFSKDMRVIELGVEYLGIIWLTYIIVAVALAFSTSLKCIRETKIPMFTTIVALICNASLNYLFIFVLHMGVRGAAIATVLSRLIEISVLLAIIYINKMPIAPRLHELFGADTVFVKGFIAITIPVVLNEFAWALGVSAYNIAYKFCGTEAQGALQISNTVMQLFMVIGIGVGYACGIMTANALGAGETERAILYSRRFMKMSVAIGIVMGAVLIACSPLIVGIFNVSDEVRNLAIKTMLVIAVTMSWKLFNFTTIVGILRNGGDTWFCFILDTLAVWLVGIPMAFAGAVWLGLPIYYVFAMVTIEELFKIFISGIRVMKNGWANKLV